jgi:hypothetical protein
VPSSSIADHHAAFRSDGKKDGKNFQPIKNSVRRRLPIDLAPRPVEGSRMQGMRSMRGRAGAMSPCQHTIAYFMLSMYTVLPAR